MGRLEEFVLGCIWLGQVGVAASSSTSAQERRKDKRVLLATAGLFNVGKGRRGFLVVGLVANPTLGGGKQRLHVGKELGQEIDGGAKDFNGQVHVAKESAARAVVGVVAGSERDEHARILDAQNGRQ